MYQNNTRPSHTSANEPSNYVHGLFSQPFEVKAFPGSIVITKSPDPLVDGVVGGSVSLECEAETAPITSSVHGSDGKSNIAYQW